MKEDIQKKNEDIRFDNEFKKLKLRMETGSEFYTDEINKIDPRLESEFLDNIIAFEEGYKNAELITVYELIGKPEFKKSEAIPDNEIKQELEKIFEYMQQNRVKLDVIYKVDDRKLYEFITRELFLKETDNIKVTGFNVHFIYEEFHPNHIEDIITHCRDFITAYLDKNNETFDFLLNKEAPERNKLYSFRNQFTKFILKNLKLITVQNDEETGYAAFDIKFTGIINENEKKIFSGICEVDLSNKFDYWIINNIKFPKPE
jgi:hypothetical protein